VAYIIEVVAISRLVGECWTVTPPVYVAHAPLNFTTQSLTISCKKSRISTLNLKCLGFTFSLFVYRLVSRCTERIHHARYVLLVNIQLHWKILRKAILTILMWQ